MPPSSQDDRSVWEILNELETKLIHSIHQSSQVVLPQVISTSQSIYDQLQSISRSTIQAFNYDILPSLKDLLPSQLQLNPSSTTPASNHAIPSIHHPSSSDPDALGLLPFSTSFITLLSSPDHTLHPTSSSSWLSRFFKPRNLIILTGLYFSSRFTLDLLITSDYFGRLINSYPTLQTHLPAWIRSRRKFQNLKANRSHHSSSARSSRLEIIVILGADPGSVGHQIAIHLSHIGFVVIASVSHPESVNILEREGSGYLKALVLNPSSHQTRAFNRSLAACLDLRFPLNSPSSSLETNSGNHHNESQVIGLINCLPISFLDDLRPVESIHLEDDLLVLIKSMTGVSLDVVKFILPMIRNSIEKFGADDGIILTLFPTKTSSVSLPYLGPSTIANQALETLMSTLRREIMISNSACKRSIRIVNESIGSFRPSTHFSPNPIDSRSSDKRPASLPVHLHSIYAPSLSRRLGFLNGPLMRTTGCLPIVSMNGSPVSQLIQRVQRILQSPGIKTGSSVSVGKEVWKFKLIRTLVPSQLLDRCLTITESLNGWVRRKVMSEIDLESNENLERVIQKRNLSSHSDWKYRFFLPAGNSSNSGDHIRDCKDQLGSSNLEGEHLTRRISSLSPSPDQDEGGDITIRKDDSPVESSDGGVDSINQEELQLIEETGSVIDKGPESEEEECILSEDGSHQLKHSFVGSEIDWKENST